MSVWLLPAVAAWIGVMILLLMRFWPRLWHTIHEANDRLMRHWEGFVEAVHDPFAAPPRRPRRQRRVRDYLQALGGYMLALFIIGLTSSVLGFGVIGTLILMIFPGALIAARVYLLLLR